MVARVGQAPRVIRRRHIDYAVGLAVGVNFNDGQRFARKKHGFNRVRHKEIDIHVRQRVEHRRCHKKGPAVFVALKVPEHTHCELLARGHSVYADAVLGARRAKPRRVRSEATQAKIDIAIFVLAKLTDIMDEGAATKRGDQK